MQITAEVEAVEIQRAMRVAAEERGAQVASGGDDDGVVVVVWVQIRSPRCVRACVSGEAKGSLLCPLLLCPGCVLWVLLLRTRPLPDPMQISKTDPRPHVFRSRVALGCV